MSVVDREALKEALDDWLQEYVWLLQQHAPKVTLEPLEMLAAGVRALVEGETIWMCEVHKAESVHQHGIDPPPYCWVAYYLHQAATSGEDCRMVRVVVVPIEVK